jgi:hypothetical protein
VLSHGHTHTTVAKRKYNAELILLYIVKSMKSLLWHIQQFKVVRVSNVLFALVGWDEGGGGTNPSTIVLIIRLSGDSQLSLSGYLEAEAEPEGKHAWLDEGGLQRSGVLANDSTADLKDSLNRAISPIISLKKESANFVNYTKIMIEVQVLT